MKCKEAEKLIPLFLDEDLENEDLREFMEHIEKWEECKEELWGAAARGSYQECEDIVALYLGLEPDYLEYLLW